MSGGFEPWEPEETVGKIWHAFASRLDAPEEHGAAAAMLEPLAQRIAVFFRGLGGPPSIEIRAVRPEASAHRLSRKRRLGAEEEYVARASFDGETLRLPARIAVFPTRALNDALYFWLAASAAHAPARIDESDPLRADLRALAAATRSTEAVLRECPGLGGVYRDLAAAALAARRPRFLPVWERAIEDAIQALLQGAAPDEPRALAVWRAAQGEEVGLDAVEAPRGYRPYEPVPLWLELRPREASARTEEQDHEPETGAPPPGEEEREAARRARRAEADQAERRDSLILHKFEAILSWAEFLNLNRRVDDDDPENARKAADDQDEVTLTQISKAPATRLKLHLDLAPEDVDRERLSAKHLYPEWVARTGRYLPDHCRVLLSEAEPAPPEEMKALTQDAAARRRIKAVRRRFEALRPRRVILPAQQDGEDLDLDAAVRSCVDLAATGEASERIWRASKPEARDLAVSILLDASRSTESAAGERTVIEVEREALTALAWGLEACGDDCAIHAFSSLRRDRVFLRRCKSFSEAMGPGVEARIAGLRPGFYTRLGAAIRHVSADLAKRARQRRLLLVVTDGKPNDLDHYEGRHGIEDSRMAIHEARMAGQAVFGVVVEPQAEPWFARIFGRGGFALTPQADRLTDALPEIYRQLVGA